MILIVGATGYLGGMITRRLLAEGRLVRVLVRASLTIAHWSKRARRLPSATFDSGIPWMWHAVGSTRSSPRPSLECTKILWLRRRSTWMVT